METQERKQYTTFKEAQQRIQEQQKAWKRTFKSSRKHGSGHSRAAESMEADTQERRMIILEFTEQVS
jgi:hypothetical protein